MDVHVSVDGEGDDLTLGVAGTLSITTAAAFSVTAIEAITGLSGLVTLDLEWVALIDQFGVRAVRQLAETVTSSGGMVTITRPGSVRNFV